MEASRRSHIQVSCFLVVPFILSKQFSHYLFPNDIVDGIKWHEMSRQSYLVAEVQRLISSCTSKMVIWCWKWPRNWGFGSWGQQKTSTRFAICFTWQTMMLVENCVKKLMSWTTIEVGQCFKELQTDVAVGVTCLTPLSLVLPMWQCMRIK